MFPPIHSTNPLGGFPDVPTDFSLDFEKVSGAIRAELPARIDGKQAILQMREEDSRQWRQMEWIGFWFEHFVTQKVLPAVGGEQGPKFGNTTIDLMLSSPWDLKAHLSESSVVILNDVEAVGECIQKHGSISYLFLCGSATYDNEYQEFKKWHDLLKGRRSRYQNEGDEIGRASRRRKTSFIPTEVLAIRLDSETLRYGLSVRVIGRFQEGMRNSNGNPRRPKYTINLARIDERFVSKKCPL